MQQGAASMLTCFRCDRTPRKKVIDCPDPHALADFYRQVLGMRVNEDINGWVIIGSEPGLRQLAFQRVTEWVPPRWPDAAYPQQLHLDVRVDDADQAEQGYSP
jgi:catechol 2,3-dioxygenase-like lactoylglutathione lyase family enzyme